MLDAIITKVATAYSSLKTVKDACENAINLTQINPKDYTEYYFFGYNIQTNNDEAFVEDIVTKCGLTSVDKISERTYLIKNSNEESDKRILERLELKNITSQYLVDLENKKYYIVNGIERVDGTRVYEYQDLLTAYELLVK